MNFWELRQAIEGAIPVWIILPMVLFVVALAVYGRRRHRS